MTHQAAYVSRAFSTGGRTGDVLVFPRGPPVRQPREQMACTRTTVIEPCSPSGASSSWADTRESASRVATHQG